MHLSQRGVEKRDTGSAEDPEERSSLRDMGAPKRVLIVEDNLDTLRSTTLLLREMGHHVDYAINGYAALDAARRFKPQVILLDLGLPGMDGFEFCRRLRTDPTTRTVRLIAITGYAQPEYRERSLAAGCEVHLVKPVAPSVLEALLAKN